MKTVAIIQARMNSSRLPGKVMRTIADFPLLWHVIRRVKRSGVCDDIVVATSVNPWDKIIGDFCNSVGVKWTVGSEEDVLSRFYFAANLSEADNIVRVTADDPFKDPSIIQMVVKVHLDTNSDYTAVNTIDMKGILPDGLDVEVFTYDTLRAAYYLATSTYDREHVTPFIYNNNEMFALSSFNYTLSSIEYLKGIYKRWTIDTEEDLMFVRWVYSKFNHFDFDFRDIVALLKKRGAEYGYYGTV